MFRRLSRLLQPPRNPPELIEQLRDTTRVNSAGFDPWGLHLDTAEKTVRWMRLLYKYFRVSVHGIENVPAGRVLLVPNHSGQIPLDGALIGAAMVIEGKPPRIVRGMVERWMPTLPFVSSLFTRCGQVVGDPENCRMLLKDDQAIMVFPEGVGGSGKLIFDRYNLQNFGTGFVRLALEANAPIVPVAVIGCEETYMSVRNMKTVAKIMGAPYAPLAPQLLLGPLGALPLPVKIDLHFGKPIYLQGDPDGSDEKVHHMVHTVKSTLQSMIDEALEGRPDLKRLDRIVRRNP